MVANAEPWTDHVVVITGGTGAVARGIVEAFLDRGATVAIVGSSLDRLQRALDHYTPFGERVMGVAADLRTATGVDRAFSTIEAERGPTRVLVNCIGVNFNRPVRDITEDDFDRVMDTNVKAVFLCCQWVARRIAAHGQGGRIVNITSGNYRYTRPGASIYSASKAAVEMLTRGLALEFGPAGITVNAVAPGLVDVPVASPVADFQRIARYYVANAPLGRLATSRDVGEAVVFLASNAAASITGETLVVDGGFSAGRFDFPLPGPGAKGNLPGNNEVDRGVTQNPSPSGGSAVGDN